MKEKKNKGARKVLLVAISAALVAAVSVSATLAYLTAKTDVKDNQFTASDNIVGEVIEPNYDPEEASKFLPGVPVDKDPMLDNDTVVGDDETFNIYGGMRLDFYIDKNCDGSYAASEQVTYEEFSRFVTINDWAKDWTDVTSTADPTAKSKYFIYNNIIQKDDGDSSAGTGSDTSSALFQSVTADKNITIDPNNSAAVSIIDVSAAPVKTTVYTKFNYKIKINGYAVKQEADIGLNEAKSLIIDGLKNM